ncbi:MAG: PKD domain-containing protein [Bacteroidota bacterium]
MRKFLQLTFFILLFSCSKIFAQSACFTYSSFPPNAPLCEGITLIFDGACSVGATSWDWNFGPNAIPTSSNLQFPGLVQFPVCGVNNPVTLTINGGGAPALTFTVNIPIYCNPVSCFTVNFPTICAGTPVTFNSSCSQPGIGSNSLTYQWDLCDGSGPTSANPTHTYTDTGCFCAKLIVTNNHGCTDFHQENAAVCITAPPSFQVSGAPTTTCASSLNVTFQSSLPTGGSPPYTYNWTFAGGNPGTFTGVGVVGQFPPSVLYPTGSWPVTLTVTDATNCSSTVTLPGYINVGNGSTSITLSNDTLCVGECAVVSTVPSSSYSWSILPTTCVTPNTIQTTPTVTYCFTCPGTYVDSLHSVVSGCAVKAAKTIHVFDKPVACINISSNPPSCSFPQTVNVTYCGPPPVAGYQYLWSFPGGIPSSFNGPVVPNGGAVTYNSCGRFTISLTVIGLAGCDSAVTLTDTVKIDCPQACYQITNLPLPGRFCAPLTLDFDAGCSTGSPTIFKWCVHKQGSPPCTPTSQGPNPSLTFPTLGCYDVTLITINAAGCTDTAINLFPGGPICVGAVDSACFTAVPLIQCAPLPVNFFNCTVDTCGVPGGTCWYPCTQWCWNFGDGGGCQSAVMEPMHNYQDTGCFDIMLVVNNCGCADTMIKVKYVCILPPIPAITYTINCDSPNVVLFTSQGSIGADSLCWSFPGGTPSSYGCGPNSGGDTAIYVTYPYPNPNAQHTASLIICNDSSGCCDTTSVTFFLRDLKALVNVDTLVCFPETSWVVDSSIGSATYTWKIFDLCNGNVQLTALNSAARSWNSNTNYGAITWPGPGRYHIWLKVGAINGCTDTVEFDVTVHGVLPGFWGAPLAGCAPITTSFHDTSNATCVSNPVTYSITWGDNTGSSAFVPVSQTLTHTYATNGTFTPIHHVKDQWGCITTDSTVGYVNTQTPTLSFYAPDTAICLGSQVCFVNLSTGTNLSYVWHFGDGDSSTLANPCHTYTSSGFFTDTLMAVDQFGCTAILIKTNYIFVGSVNIDFYVNDSSETCPTILDTFFVTPPIAAGCGLYYWSFGDGTYSTLEQPIHIYGFAGTFTVSLIATDICLGCSDTVTKVDYIFLGGPYSNPSATPDTGCAPQTVQFDLDPTNSVSFLWDFDDGTPLFNGSSSVSHQYADSGVYYPSVILTDSTNTCTYTRVVDTVVVIQPVALFTSSTNDLCSNGSVTFTNQSHALGGIVSYHWDFGDFTISTLQNPPPHSYNTFGEYIVTLTITSHGGCTDFFSDTIHVTDAPSAIPLAPLAGCLGIQIQFNCDSVGTASICRTHWDFGVTGITTDTSNICNPLFLYPAPGVYTVTYIVYGCNFCNDTAISTVTVDPQPVANAGPDVTICFEDTTELIATGGTIAQWIDSAAVSLSSLNTYSTFAFPVVTTTYTFIATDANGCKDTDDVVLTITQPPVANISAGGTICPGDSFTLTATGGTTYHWNTGETTASITVTPGTTTIYTVTASVGTCSDDTFATISVLPLPICNPGSPAEFCFGDSTQLNGSGGISFTWSPGNSLSDSTIFNPMANPTITTTYTLIVTDANGCTNDSSVEITVHPLPIIDAGAYKKVCSGTCTQLNVTGAIFYGWTPSIGLLNDSIPNPICCPADTTTYYVSGTDVYGCVGNDSITIFVLFPFTVTYPNDTCFCFGEKADLCAVSTTQSTYQWKPPYGLDTTTVPCVTVSPSITTSYTIYVSDSLGCYADTGDVVVCIYQLPNVVSGPDATILVGTSTDLSGYNTTTPGTGAFEWFPDSTLSCYTCENPEASPLQTITYIVQLTDQHGCKDQDTTVVKVFCNDNALFVPNAFTPNGDGKNDVFHLDGKGISELHYLRIYNRWGQLVFETKSFNSSWDGRVNGKKSEPEVFDYYLEAVCTTGETIRKQGNITLIR